MEQVAAGTARVTQHMLTSASIRAGGEHYFFNIYFGPLKMHRKIEFNYRLKRVLSSKIMSDIFVVIEVGGVVPIYGQVYIVFSIFSYFCRNLKFKKCCQKS